MTLRYLTYIIYIIGIIKKGCITITINEHNNFSRQFRPLSELNLIDNFLFSTLMETPEYAEAITKLIIKRATGRNLDNIEIEYQKAINGKDTDKHGIRLDVLIKVTGSDNSIKEVYGIEPNIYNDTDIAKRNRYYNALKDSKLLSSGHNYKMLPELITIWIFPYDPFGDNRMIYSIKNIVAENPALVYNDGILTLFLNAKGEIGGNDSLKHLLDFLINTNDDNAIDSDLENIQHIVHTIKSNAKVGERYMSMLDDLYHEKNKSKEEGIKLGKEQLAETLLELGVDPLLLEKAMKVEPK